MAIIKCYECGKEVSDKANTCPHCGAPLKMSTPPPISVNPRPTQPQQGIEVGLHAQKFTCPGCGARLQSKDILSSGWAHCPQCNRDVQLGGINNSFSDGLIEKIYPYDDSKEDFHVKCMNKLMEVAPADIYSNIRNIKTTRKYFWVREFGRGQTRQIMPMCDYGKEVFRNLTGSEIMDSQTYEKIWPMDRLVEFNSTQIKGCELVAKEMSAKEVKHQYGINGKSRALQDTNNYYCLPVLEETYEYNGKKYICYAVKNAFNDGTSYQLCSNEWPLDTEILGKKPKYTNMMPVTTTVSILVVIAAIAIVIGFYIENGFWGTLLFVGIAALILSFVGVIIGGAIIAIPMGIDAIIRTSVNRKRRLKFRARYDEIQKHKQDDALRYHNLKIGYTVPEFRND